MGDFLVFKRLMLHHMAPMTGRITDAQKDWFILALRFVKGFFAPRKPVHRIMRVLEEIGAGLMGQAVGVFMVHDVIAVNALLDRKPPGPFRLFWFETARCHLHSCLDLTSRCQAAAMEEHILAAIVRLDEAEAFLPHYFLNGARHIRLLRDERVAYLTIL